MASSPPKSCVPDDEAADLLDVQVVCHNTIGIATADWADHPINLSLQEAGIDGFLLLQTPQDKDLEELGCTNPTSHAFVKLSVSQRGLLRGLIAFCHEASRERGAALDPGTPRKGPFNQFRSTAHNPNAPIHPWHVPVESRDVTNLKKSIKK